ncbi:hypothetical protein BGZ93_006888 [Podila epicladia]|nr:hypothetical protein BGZ92_001841 [Podila epicladia]KAG0094692.1 hypothetical protein BGZ93_006888 [Podila epicladia]
MSNPGKTPSKRGSRPKGPGRGQAKTKIVVRRLPANLPEHVFADSIKPLVPDTAMDRPFTWVAGKVSKNPVKGNSFARAYIYFKVEKLALEFQKAYHGHIFVDRQGNEGRAHVEFAPFQKIPREQRKADPKQGTIEEDPEYIAFLQSMNAEPTEADKEMKLSGTELLLKESAVNPKSTPLLEALRAQKAAAQAKAQAAKLAARQARQGKAGLSNSSKAQITILANRNAANKPGTGSSNRTSGPNKPQQNQAQGGQQVQGKKPAPVDEGANAKPKRERKRRDRAGKRAANEHGAPSTSGDTTLQITLLKPHKPVSIMAKPESNPTQEPRHSPSDTATQPTKNDGVNGGGGGEGRSGRRRNRGDRNKEPKPANSNSKQGEGSGTPANQASNKAPTPGSGASTRSGRSRRNRGGADAPNSAQG